MSSLILTFNTDLQRDEFIQYAIELIARDDEDAANPIPPELKKVASIMKTFNALVVSSDPTPATATCKTCDCPTPKSEAEKHALFVSGKKMTEGTLPEMQKLFKQELVQHSGSVQVRALRDGTWTVVMQRAKR